MFQRQRDPKRDGLVAPRQKARQELYETNLTSTSKVIDARYPFFVEETIANFPEPNLTNQIPDFLRFEKWHTHEYQKFKFFAYPDQAARLIWRTLLHHLPIWHAILFGTMKAVPARLKGEFGKVIHVPQYPEPLAMLTPKQTHETMERLMEVADKLYIRVGHLVDEAGRTAPTTTKLKLSSGQASLMEIDREVLDNITTALNNKNHFLVAYYSLKLCTTFVHEMAHALALARFPQSLVQFNNICIGNAYLAPSSYTSEIGYEVENRIWGGIVTAIDQSKEQIYTIGNVQHRLKTVLREYPAQNITDRYANNPEYNIDVRGTIPPVHFIWRIPVRWLAEIYQEGFWDRVDRDDKAALSVPKELGFPTNVGSSYTGSLATTRKVPDGYRMEADMTIVRDDWDMVDDLM